MQTQFISPPTIDTPDSSYTENLLFTLTKQKG